MFKKVITVAEDKIAANKHVEQCSFFIVLTLINQLLWSLSFFRSRIPCYLNFIQRQEMPLSMEKKIAIFEYFINGHTYSSCDYIFMMRTKSLFLQICAEQTCL